MKLQKSFSDRLAILSLLQFLLIIFLSNILRDSEVISFKNQMIINSIALILCILIICKKNFSNKKIPYGVEIKILHIEFLYKRDDLYTYILYSYYDKKQRKDLLSQYLAPDLMYYRQLEIGKSYTLSKEVTKKIEFKEA